MSQDKTTLSSMVIIPVWKNKEIVSVLQKFKIDYVTEVTVVIDEPTDEFIEHIRENSGEIKPKLNFLSNPKRMGIGNAIRMGLEYGISKNYDVVVVMAGNGKDNPNEIPKFLSKIEEGYDYIQGSRFLKGGKYDGLPIQRRIFTRLWPWFWTILTWRKQTEVTNGFRAYRFDFLKDSNINLNQEWLNGYALEYYIHFKAMKYKKYSCTEVPVSKIYHQKTNYTKIQPLKDWHHIILPPIVLFLKIRK